LKAVIAYRSIIHIGVCTPVLVGGRFAAPTALLAILVAHGLVSPVLFSLATTVGRAYSRRMLYVCRALPRLNFALLRTIALALVFNAGFPPTLNFITEVLSLFYTFKLRNFFGLVFCGVFVMGGLYGIFI